MIIYWILLLIPIIAFLTPVRVDSAIHKIQWSVFWLFLTIVIGLRHEVGGDWMHYLYDNELYNSLSGLPFLDLFTKSNLAHDIGFLIIHWFSQNLFNGIYTTNLICAGIFTLGLLRLCKSTPEPWLALSIAVPYLVVVVAMGYTRQSAALGFIMWGLVDLMNHKKGRFYISVILAVLFHKTALIMLLFGVLNKDNFFRKWEKKDYLILIIALVFVAAIFNIFQHMIYFYITNTDMNSYGALIRISMGVVAAIVFFLFKKRWKSVYKDSNLWSLFSMAILLLTPLVFIISTTVDRIALYLLPMQIVIFTRITILIIDNNIKYIFMVAILSMYVLVLYIWLNYGLHSVYWLPYKNILF